tara:strand:- start:106 stop:642 length:537 start_codon:yes stop_codon:yes gene_type:complete
MKKYGWVFTLNNYAEGEIPLCRRDSAFKWVSRWVHPNLAYIGFGREVASSTGTPHLQGMVVFTRSVGIRTLKKLNERAHWQPMRGTFEEAQKYCSKENYCEWSIPGITKKHLKDKVEEDHLRAKVISDENESIEALSKAVYRQSKDIAALQADLKEIVQLNKYMLKKLNTCLNKDKFV